MYRACDNRIDDITLAIELTNKLKTTSFIKLKSIIVMVKETCLVYL